MTGKPWSRDEDILTLDLYLPERKVLSPRHTEVVELSELTGKKPGSIRMRMKNIQWLDPKISGGLYKYAKQTKEVWDEFSSDLPRLKKVADDIRRKLQQS